MSDPCLDGDGTCNNNDECEGMLECGNDNCNQTTGIFSTEDDCCQSRCTVDRPCPQGKVIRIKIRIKINLTMQGPCLTDDECEQSGYNVCQGSCLDRDYFPLDKYPDNTEENGYNSEHT